MAKRNGTAENDIINGTQGNDWLNGKAGDDQIYGFGGEDTLIGNSGDDWLYGGGNRDSLWGGIGDDMLFGQGDNDELQGGDGDDELYGGDGMDTLTGGAGADMFTFDTSDGVNTITDFSVAERDKIIISRDDYEVTDDMADDFGRIKVSIADNGDHTDIVYDSRVVMTLNDIDHADVIENFDSYFEIW